MEMDYMCVHPATQADVDKIEALLMSKDGVDLIAWDASKEHFEIHFDTPVNMDILEKEVYDAGYTIL